MKIAVLTHYIHPDVFTNSRLLMDVARGIAKHGHEVTFLSASPTSKEVEPELPAGVSVKRHWAPKLDRQGIKRRLIISATVSVLVFIRLLFNRKPDVILVDTVMPFQGLCIWAISRLRGHKYVYLATEIFPDAAVALGVLRPGGTMSRIWDFTNRLVYGRAVAVIVIGPRLRHKVARHLDRGIDSPKLHVVHNWADPNEIKPISKSDNWWVKEQGLEGKFIVLYSGNMGLSHDLGTLIEAADELRDEKKLSIVLIGEGPSKSKLVTEAKRRSLKNVVFLPYQPAEILPFSLTSGDLSVVTLSTEMEKLTIPSKLYPAMAGGQAILALMGPGTEVGEMVLEHEIGIRVTQGDVTGLVSELKRLLTEPRKVNEMKLQARKVFEKNYTRERSVGAYIRILESVANS